MTVSRSARWFILALVVAVLAQAGAALAQQAQQPPTKPYEPQVGQAGKDVVWVPTPQALVDKMLDLAKVTPQDFLMDLGSGDGRTVITAAKRGTKAMGIEYNPDMVELSKANAVKEGVTDRATFMKADLFETDFSQATVITMFLLPDINLRLRPKLLDMKPGTRIVSNSFTMGEWEPDERATVEQDCTSWCTALFWIVPAKVEGRWRIADASLTLTQQFQKVSGTFDQIGGTSTAITDGRLRGEEISFTINGARYTGRVNGSTMQGTVTTDQGTKPWTASK
jgi:hypothetical protein